MKIRFQADADLNQIILQAEIRREPNIDFLTAEAADLIGRKVMGHLPEGPLLIGEREVDHDLFFLPD